MTAAKAAAVWSFGWSQDAFDLADVVDVVSGDHADHVFDRLLTALGVLAEMFPLPWGERLEEREVGFAQRALELDGFFGIAFFVVAGDDPGVLIVGLNRRSGVSEDGAHAPADYDFDVGEVSEDFGDRPFVGSRALAKFGGGNTFDEARQFFWRSGLDLDRILALSVCHDALRVLLNCFGHFIFIIQPRPCWRARPVVFSDRALCRLTNGQSP